MSTYGLQAVSVNGAQFFGCRGHVLDLGNKIESEGSDGTVFEQYHTMLQRPSVASWSTIACKQMMTALGTSGTAQIPFVALDGANGLVLVHAKASPSAPGYSASAVHHSSTGLNGVIVMESFKWSLGSFAVMAMKGYPISTNGTTAALAISDTAALPTQSSSQQGYSLSALTLNGVAAASVSSVSITIGHKFDFDFLAGCPYPTAVTGAGPKGRAEIRMEAEIRDVSQTEGSGTCSAVFTNNVQGGTFGASTITHTFNAAWALKDSDSAANTSPSATKLVVRPLWNGSTNPYTWAIT